MHSRMHRRPFQITADTSHRSFAINSPFFSNELRVRCGGDTLWNNSTGHCPSRKNPGRQRLLELDIRFDVSRRCDLELFFRLLVHNYTAEFVPHQRAVLQVDGQQLAILHTLNNPL